MRHHLSRAARILVVAAATLGVLGGFTLIGWTGSNEPKPGPEPVPEGSSAPDGVPDQAGETVPAIADASGGPPCPNGSHAFHNPVMHYRLCYPSRWGFSDFSTTEPLEQIPVVQLENLHLLSEQAFPWVVGSYPFDVVVARRAIDVELNLLQEGAEAEGECSPTKVRAVGDQIIRTCSQTYDVTGRPAESGPVTAVKFVVPLLRTPSGGPSTLDLADSALLVVVRTSTARAAEEVDLGWQLVSSITPY